MSSLPLRPFGKTGENHTALGLGGGFVGFAGFDRSVATVHRALELGVRLLDTSVMYLNGASQPIFGAALAGRADQPFLATKIGYFKDPRHYRSVEAMHVQLQENLRLLRRDSVDMLQMHEADWDQWWTDRPDLRMWELFDLEGSYDFANAPVIRFLREAKARGLCRRIGITGNNSRHVGRVLRELDGIDSVLIAYNYQPLNASAREHVIPIATAKGVAVMVAGLFTFVNSLPPDWRNEKGTYLGKNADRQLADLKKLQQACGVPMTDLAMGFVVGDPNVSTILVGAHDPAVIEGNVASFLRGPLPADLHAAVDAIARQFV
jgi:aryl-alcohol dehydrogenase-like predicted oxidoreductase